MSVPRDPWAGVEPVDPQQLADAEDRVFRDLREDANFPDIEHEMRVAYARAPKPGVPLRRPTQKEGEQ